MHSAPRPFKKSRARPNASAAELLKAVSARWASLPLGIKGMVVVAIPLGALFIAVLLSYAINQQHAEAARWVDHTHEVRAGVQEVSTLVSEASTGVRGFMLTERDDFLDPYRHAQETLPGALERLSVLVGDNPEQLARAERVGRSAYQQLAMLEALRLGVSTNEKSGAAGTAALPAPVETALVASKTELDTLRGELASMISAEDRLLERRSVRLERLERWPLRAVFANLLFGLLGGGVATVLFIAGITRRIEYLERNAKRLACGAPLLPPMPGRDAIGRLNRALDSTAARLREQALELRESEARLRNVIATAPIALQVVDADGVFTFSEGKGLDALGRTPGELVGQSVFEAYKNVPQVLENQRRALAGESFASRIEFAGLAFDVRYAPAFEYGQVTAVTIVANDVTARWRAERVLLRYQRVLERQNRALADVNRTKDAFLAHMSHELRTPLTAIIGFSDLLKDEYFGPLNAKQHEHVATIMGAGEHLLSLINDLLDLSKIEAGRMELYSSPVDMSAAVKGALAVIEGQAQKKRVQLGADLPQGVAPLSADARKVKQILYNLLSNAVKFTPDEGRVQLSMYDSEGEVRVEVRDTGPGISSEDQKRLFKPFTQLSSPKASAVEGTGLGLALTKQLVELHGGRVWLRSQLGHGSTFGFALPRRLPTVHTDAN